MEDAFLTFPFGLECYITYTCFTSAKSETGGVLRPSTSASNSLLALKLYFCNSVTSDCSGRGWSAEVPPPGYLQFLQLLEVVNSATYAQSVRPITADWATREEGLNATWYKSEQNILKRLKDAYVLQKWTQCNPILAFPPNAIINSPDLRAIYHWAWSGNSQASKGL